MEAGPLRLDLFHRDAQLDEGWLALHPREFELLWRLAETPERTVSQRALLQDVWRLPFEPGTNRVAVHIARLRRKLAVHGLDAMIATDGPGYRLIPHLAPFLPGVPGVSAGFLKALGGLKRSGGL